MVLNGRLPDSMLGTIPGTSRRVLVQLVPQVAALRRAFAARFGKPLVVTDAYRDYDTQVALKIDKGPYAATPGTSVHGWGRALDLGSGVNDERTAEHAWLRQNGPRFGVHHPVWAHNDNPSDGQEEPWHFEMGSSAVPVSNYQAIGGAVPTAPTTTPVAPIEEDVVATLDEVREAVRGVVAEQIAPLLAAAGSARWYRLDGGNLAWLDLGVARRRGTLAQYQEDPNGVTALPADDPFWALPIVGDAFGELYRRTGQEAAWLLEADPDEAARTGRGVRRWPGRDPYLAHGSPRIVDLPATHPFWTLRPVGVTPPEGS